MYYLHQRLCHVSINSNKKLINLDLVRELSPKKYELKELCNACMQGKHTKLSFKLKEMISTSTPL
jgi:GAG-pre-integrase domain